MLQNDVDASAQRHIFHVAYYESLLTTRAVLLERSGYRVSSALGNDNAKALSRTVGPVDLAVIGFSAAHAVRAELLQWFKLRHPEIPVVVLQAHTSEKFPGADCVALSEDPEIWLGVVADCVKKG
jgi:DNA-binding NtrC family response regulator